MSLSTHVLDAAAGRPASGVPVRLEIRGDGGWELLADAVTDAGGRARDLPAGRAGTYRLTFDTAALSAFFPEVSIAFVIAAPGEHHHVPLLLSPFAYSTYRGS